MSDIGWVHVIAGWLALAAGLLNLASTKGTGRHRALGYLFVFSLALLDLCALSLHRLTGGFNLFHAFAVLSLATSVWAMLPLARRRTGWVRHHALRMQGAYVGLCAAAANEILSREVLHWVPMPDKPFWLLSILVSALVTSTGLLLARRQRGEIRRLEAALA